MKKTVRNTITERYRKIN